MAFGALSAVGEAVAGVMSELTARSLSIAGSVTGDGVSVDLWLLTFSTPVVSVTVSMALLSIDAIVVASISDLMELSSLAFGSAATVAMVPAAASRLSSALASSTVVSSMLSSFGVIADAFDSDLMARSSSVFRSETVGSTSSDLLLLSCSPLASSATVSPTSVLLGAVASYSISDLVARSLIGFG